MNIRLKIRNFVLIVPITLFSFSSVLEAKERTMAFERNDIFVDITAGVGRPSGAPFPTSGSPLHQVEAMINLTSSNQQRQLLGLMQMNAYKDPVSDSAKIGTGVEIALSNWFGLGISLSSANAGYKDYYSTPLEDPNLWFVVLVEGGTINGQCASSLLNTTCRSSAPGVWEMYTLLPNKFRYPVVKTLDIKMGIHFPAGLAWDPYIKIITGFGNIEGGSVGKLGAAIGFRFSPGGGRFFLFAEGQYASYMVIADEEDNSGEIYLDTFRDNSLDFGVGIRI